MSSSEAAGTHVPRRPRASTTTEAGAVAGHDPSTPGRVGEAVGALCMAAVVVGMVGGVVTSALVGRYGLTGLAVPLVARTHLLTFGTTVLFAGVLLVGVVMVLLSGERGPSSMIGIATLVAAVPLGALVVAGTGLDLWSYASLAHGSGVLWPMSARALAVVPALAATWLALSRTAAAWSTGHADPATLPEPDRAKTEGAAQPVNG